MNINKHLLLIGLVCYLSCNESNQKSESDFTLIDRRTYTMDSHNGLGVYRDAKSGKLMDGYYIVGNEMTKWEEFNLDKGILNGNYITYHQNGNMASKGEYVKGKLHGSESTYYLSGKLKSNNQYHKSVRHGKSVAYYESGQISEESIFENHELVESTGYNMIGEIVSQTFNKDGRIFTQSIRGGKVFTEQISSTYDDYEAVKLYNDDGTVKYFIRMIDDASGSFIIELDENENEIRRIDVKKNPQEAMKFAQMLGMM